MPTAIRIIDTVKGKFQLPVRSIIQPPTTGLMIAASAEPEFMMPHAVPECFGAMSIGTDHIGPIVISLKKKPAETHRRERDRDVGDQHDRRERQKRQQHAHADHHVARQAHVAALSQDAVGE